MDRLLFTTVAHATHRVLGPLSMESFDGLAGGCALRPGQRVVDIGCGKGALLLRLAERHGIRGIGVDINESFLLQARATAVASGIAKDQVQFRNHPAMEMPMPSEPIDLALCVGATHAFGGFVPTLEKLHALVRHGGHALVGEGFWQQPPHPDYLSHLGGAADDHLTLEAGADAARAAGWALPGRAVSTPDEWDDYEDRYAANIESWVAANPAHPQAAAFLERSRHWRAMYLAHGRQTLGFAVHRLRRT